MKLYRILYDGKPRAIVRGFLEVDAFVRAHRCQCNCEHCPDKARWSYEEYVPQPKETPHHARSWN